MEKIILTDADGVLLNWELKFNEWMFTNGYGKLPGSDSDYSITKRYNVSYEEKRRLVRNFNESSSIRFLPPHKDAVKYVRKLHEEFGYVFRVITSLSNDFNAQRLRDKNLRELFGSAIEEIICLDTGADKDEVLSKYKGRDMLWVEDKIENAEVGQKIGLTSVIMAHTYNEDYEGPCQRVANWKEIYEQLAA